MGCCREQIYSNSLWGWGYSCSLAILNCCWSRQLSPFGRWYDLQILHVSTGSHGCCSTVCNLLARLLTGDHYLVSFEVFCSTADYFFHWNLYQLPKILELVGLGYTGWFVYRYLLFKVKFRTVFYPSLKLLILPSEYRLPCHRILFGIAHNRKIIFLQ